MMGLLTAPPHPLNLFLLSRVIFTSFPPKCSMTVRCKSFPSSVISLVRNVKRFLICSTKNLSTSHLSVFLVCLSISQSSTYLFVSLPRLPCFSLSINVVLKAKLFQAKGVTWICRKKVIILNVCLLTYFKTLSLKMEFLFEKQDLEQEGHSYCHPST